MTDQYPDDPDEGMPSAHEQADFLLNCLTVLGALAIAAMILIVVVPLLIHGG